MHDSVYSLARRAAGDPHFLASALAAYASVRNLDEAALMSALNATPDTLASARLCRLPADDSLAVDVARIAEKFGLNRDVLTAAVRLAEVSADLAGDPGPVEDVSAQLAARDRPPS